MRREYDVPSFLNALKQLAFGRHRYPLKVTEINVESGGGIPATTVCTVAGATEEYGFSITMKVAGQTPHKLFELSDNSKCLSCGQLYLGVDLVHQKCLSCEGEGHEL